MARIGGIALAVAILGVPLLPAAQVFQGKTRPAKTGTLMKVLFKPHFGAVETALKGAGPQGEAAWGTLYEQAAVLNEMAHALLEDGRCPDKAWAGACSQLKEASFRIMAATDRKDVKEARAGAAAIKASCAACHSAHKK